MTDFLEFTKTIEASYTVDAVGDGRPALPEGLRYTHPADSILGRYFTETVVPDGAVCAPNGRYDTVVIGFRAPYGWDYPCGLPTPFAPSVEDVAAYYGEGDIRRQLGYYSSFDQVVHTYALPTGSDTRSAYTWFAWFFQLGESHGPWHSEPVFRKHFRRIAEHMPEFSKNNPGMLSYYQSVDKRFRGIRTPIKPGKYLKKYFSDVLTEEEIQVLGIRWQAKSMPPKLTITQDADEIEAVYRGAYLGSCMHFGSGYFDGDEHPARVYAGPDLGLAYIGDRDDADGRVLVWPDRKQYIDKMYGDTNRLSEALDAAGYTRVSRDKFVGARLQRIKSGGAFVMPYLDFCDHAEDAGDFLIANPNGDIFCRNTNGLSGEIERFTCVITGWTSRDEDDFEWVDQADGLVCYEELHDNWFRCAGDGEYHHNDDKSSLFDDSWSGRKIYYSVSYLESSDEFRLCEGSGEWVREEDAIVLHDGTVWSPEYFEDHGAVCDICGDAYAIEDMVTTEDGQLVAKEHAPQTDDEMGAAA